ncbi:MAG TPA: MFS transporter, partial [Candidatus Dormibacteraeota bacterium]|nr:MFS transporter [Candidatus Dormibacteraeota bacterium]
GPVLSSIAAHLHFSAALAAWANPIYTIGMLAGALVFGSMADRLGRRRLFMVTLAIYAVGTILTGFAWNFDSLAVFRVLTGIGIGGEFSAINCAIDEFVPARYRGRTDGLINASWNLGAIAASSIALFALGNVGGSNWRLVFWFGAALAVGVLLVRRFVPESPRWLLARGRVTEARAIVAEIELSSGANCSSAPDLPIEFTPLTPANGYRAQILELISTTPKRLLFSFVVNLAEVMPYYGILAIAGIAIFPAVGLHGVAIPLLYLLGACCGLTGQIISSLLMDRWGRRPTMLFGFTMAALGSLALAFALGNGDRFVMTYALFSLFSAWVGSGAYVITSELFPTHLRATGIGLSVAVGRVGAILAPLGFYALFVHAGVAPVFVVMGAIFAVGAIALLWWFRYGVEGRNRSLEAMLADGVM